VLTRKTTLATVFLLWWLAFSAWAFATPSWGAPDEFQHAYRAYALVRGDVYVKPEAASYGTGGYVDVPKGWTSTAEHYRCFTHIPDVVPACAGPITNDATNTRAPSTAARYNPAYYAVVGLGSFGTSPTHASYVMRIISAALAAFFIAWAFTSAARSKRPRFAQTAVVFTCTPMVGFLAGSINPNSLEIAAAMSAWVNGALLLLNNDGEAFFTRRLAISLIALVVTRALSPLWIVVMIAVLAVAALNVERAKHINRKWIAAVTVVGLASIAWTFAAKTLKLAVESPDKTYGFFASLQHLWEGGDRMQFYLYGTVGIFGWLDGFQPTAVMLPWIAGVFLLAVLGLFSGTMRMRVALLILIVCVVTLPFIIEAADYNTSGKVWQPRYTMPIALGVPLLASLLFANVRELTISEKQLRIITIALGVIAVWTIVIGFLYALGRNTVGGETIAFSGDWHPPIPGLALTLVYGIAFSVLATVALRAPRTSPTIDASSPSPESHSSVE
jgi:hypothetical protein